MSDGRPSSKVPDLTGYQITSTTTQKFYYIKKFIAQGSYGKAFLCTDDKDKTRVVKVVPLLCNGSQQGQATRGEKVTIRAGDNLSIFFREAKIGLEINNFNCIKYYDIWTDNEFFYVSMDYCEGETFEKYLSSGALPEEEALEFLKQILNAMKYFHICGKVHRDLKPDNMFMRNGELLVADFGFAKDLDVNTDKVSNFKGTRLYSMDWKDDAPNNCAQDIYGVGVIFYRMVFGMHPFYEEYDSAAHLQKKMEEFTMGKLEEKYRSVKGREISEEMKNLFVALLLNPILRKECKWQTVMSNPLVMENGEFELNL